MTCFTEHIPNVFVKSALKFWNFPGKLTLTATIWFWWYILQFALFLLNPLFLNIEFSEILRNSSGCFFHDSSPFSVPKWKKLAQPVRSFFTFENFLKVALVGCNLFFILVLKIGRKVQTFKKFLFSTCSCHWRLKFSVVPAVQLTK